MAGRERKKMGKRVAVLLWGRWWVNVALLWGRWVVNGGSAMGVGMGHQEHLAMCGLRLLNALLEGKKFGQHGGLGHFPFCLFPLFFFPFSFPVSSTLPCYFAASRLVYGSTSPCLTSPHLTTLRTLSNFTYTSFFSLLFRNQNYVKWLSWCTESKARWYGNIEGM